MAIAKVSFYSTSLSRFVNFQVLIPNDAPEYIKAGNLHYNRPTKTLFLLHGYSNYEMEWILHAPVSELSVKYNLAMVFPCGENSFYLDGKATGRKYGTFVGEELVHYVRETFGLAKRPEDTFIGGESMGGFGALHTALTYNHTFSKVMALSSALIVHQISKMRPGTSDNIGSYEYYDMVFGNLENVVESENNPEVLVNKILDNKDVLPEIYMAVGTEDFLYENNQAFKKFLEEKEVPFVYQEGPGSHDFVFWNQHLEPAILWMLG